MESLSTENILTFNSNDYNAASSTDKHKPKSFEAIKLTPMSAKLDIFLIGFRCPKMCFSYVSHTSSV